MKLRSLPLAAALFIAPLAAAAQDQGLWFAASSNARAITGDISITETKLTINFLSFTIARIRDLKAEELTALFDADPSAAGQGFLYRLQIPAAQRFLRKNTLCGSEETQWMAVYISGHNLRLAFFSNATPPKLSFEELNNSSDVCGHFTYER
jgi:hypothetical protein